jgi:hypothetical protein
MTNQTYLEAIEQSAEKVYECIEMLSPAAGDIVIDRIIQRLQIVGHHLSCAIADETMQRAVISREHKGEKV